ncbi:MAG TPA: hypothetical protein VI412_03185 [Tabrizicola sp.]
MDDDWFTDLTGLPSDRAEVVRKGIHLDGEVLTCLPNGRRMVAGRLLTPSLGDLPPPPTGPQRITVTEVVADVRALHADPANAGALFQVASQFNLLEMIGPHIPPEAGIARYASDLTQGPACAMACAAGTIYRAYFAPVGAGVGQTHDRQLDMLADLGRALGNADASLWEMRNGYALPPPGGLPKVASRIVATDRVELTRLLRVGVQQGTEVTLPGAGHLVHQVYASALPVAYSPYPPTDWGPFARLVLDAAYQATLAVGLALGARRVFLTRLGGGAFGNPADWITNAIDGAVHAYRAAPLDIRIVSHGRANPDNLGLIRPGA